MINLSIDNNFFLDDINSINLFTNKKQNYI